MAPHKLPEEPRSDVPGPAAEWLSEDDEIDEELLSELWNDDGPLGDEEIEEDNRRMLRRQRNFREAAEHVAEVFSQFSGVEKVVLFGSVALPLKKEVPRFRRYRDEGIAIWHECKDVDVAVWLSDLTQLGPMRRATARSLAQLSLGVANHQVDVFIIEPGTDRYLGRLCAFAQCPKGKQECHVTGCGEPKFLRKHDGFVLKPEALRTDRIVVLYDG